MEQQYRPISRKKIVDSKHSRVTPGRHTALIRFATPQPHTHTSATTPPQVSAIMSAVTVGEDGIVAVKEVADAVAGVMCALKQLETRQHLSSEDAGVNEFKASRQAEGRATVAGMDADGFKVK